MKTQLADVGLLRVDNPDFGRLLVGQSKGGKAQQASPQSTSAVLLQPQSTPQAPETESAYYPEHSGTKQPAKPKPQTAKWSSYAIEYPLETEHKDKDRTVSEVPPRSSCAATRAFRTKGVSGSCDELALSCADPFSESVNDSSSLQFPSRSSCTFLCPPKG